MKTLEEIKQRKQFLREKLREVTGEHDDYIYNRGLIIRELIEIVDEKYTELENQLLCKGFPEELKDYLFDYIHNVSKEDASEYEDFFDFVNPKS